MFEDKTNPAAEVEAQQSQNTSQESEIENDQSENEQEIVENDEELEDSENSEENESGEDESDIEETEFEGKKYKVPKELKAALLRQSDYTKKTQEVAEARKKVEADQQRIVQAAEFQRAELKNYSELHSLEARIKEYEDFMASPEWLQMIDSNTAEAMKHDQQYKILQNLRNQKAHDIETRARDMSLKQQQELAKREEETRSALSREVKGWSSDLEQKLMGYAKEHGVSEKEFKNAVKYDATAIKILHKAHLYDQLKKTLANKPKNPETKPIKTIRPLSSAASNALSEKDSINDWMKKREAQLRNKK